MKSLAVPLPELVSNGAQVADDLGEALIKGVPDYAEHHEQAYFFPRIHVDSFDLWGYRLINRELECFFGRSPSPRHIPSMHANEVPA